MVRYINVKSRSRTEFIDITDKVQESLNELGVSSGVYIFVPHTTAAVTVNEGVYDGPEETFRRFLTGWSLLRGTISTGKAILPPI